MDPNEYQKLAGRTECDQVESRYRMGGVSNNMEPSVPLLLPIRLNHAALGIAAEGGELLSLIQKWIYYGKPLDKTGFQEELGDAMWYIAEACNALGINLSDVMEANLRKLRARYPEKYTNERAAEENRDLEAELRAIKSSHKPKDYLGNERKDVIYQDGHGFGHSDPGEIANKEDGPDYNKATE